MTIEDLADLFSRHEDEYLQFDKIRRPRHRRPDVCAFLMLDACQPRRPARPGDIISAAEHDKIYLDVDVEVLVASEPSSAFIRDLSRCGVCFDADEESLYLFV